MANCRRSRSPLTATRSCSCRWTAGHPNGDTRSQNQLLLHTVGASWPVQWVTVHDTAINGTDPFDANALAKAAGATPFKRPENGQFQPGSHFRTFVFVITGDTDNIAGTDPVLAARGAWGGIFRVDLDANRESGNISLVVLGDADHAAFDNITFVDDKDTVLVTEDRGDLLHDQLNTLDSIWAYKLDQASIRREASRLDSLRSAWIDWRRMKITNRPGCTCLRETPRSED